MIKLTNLVGHKIAHRYAVEIGQCDEMYGEIAQEDHSWRIKFLCGIRQVLGMFTIGINDGCLVSTAYRIEVCVTMKRLASEQQARYERRSGMTRNVD